TWVLDNFPENYENRDYMEPFCGSANIFFHKVKSQQEIIGDEELGIIQIYRALRDEPEAFIAKLKRTTCSERVFRREHQKLDDGNFEDYMCHAISEFIVRKMSKNEGMTSFSDDDESWKNSLKQLP